MVRWWRGWRRVLVAVAACVLVGPAPSAVAATKAFVWPASGWVGANSEYRNHEKHYGSADITAPYWTPVTAARGGTVRYSGWQSYSGSRNLIVEITHGSGYVTRYGHFVEQPLVAVGQTVRTNQLLGYVGRTGRAPDPHLHFAIMRNGVDLPIPGLTWGAWVRQGAFVAGDWTSLAATTSTRFGYDVRTIEALPVHAEPRQSSTVVATVAAGSTLRVSDTDRGYLRISVGGGTGWVVGSGVEFVSGRVRGVEVLRATDVWTEPQGGTLLGTLPAGHLATIFEDTVDRLRVLFGLPTVRGWLSAGDVQPTTRFRTNIATPTAVRTAPDISAPSVGTLAIGECQRCGGIGNDRTNNYQVVLSVRRGWYEIVYGGASRWVAGWATPGRH